MSDDKRTDGGILRWGIKKSLREYVAGPADGQFTVNGSVVPLDVESFGFPATASAYDISTGLGMLRFEGTVEFTGHHGMRVATVTDPWIQITPEGAVLSTVRWPGRAARIVLANLVLGQPTHENGRLAWHNVSATLSTEGGEIFGDVYAAGEALDPISIEVLAN
ncbi:hypothetical protein GCM10023063_36790 [Arthrobacter methylotrophus]|uniref:HtaA domain-containing protein n=1 Tax=Arthrobacter methylotrophus TaxID=121291 RepID=A0ABV5UJL7_9MICC